MLEDPASLTICQGDKSARVMLYAEDEVMDVIDRINRAVYEGLGQKELVAEEDCFKFASFVNYNFPGIFLLVDFPDFCRGFAYIFSFKAGIGR